jgi:hypothetical protein
MAHDSLSNAHHACAFLIVQGAQRLLVALGACRKVGFIVKVRFGQGQVSSHWQQQDPKPGGKGVFMGEE